MTSSPPTEDTKPRDVRLTELLLETAGLHQWDDQVVPMLLEIAFRYVTDVLSDALVFSDHAARSTSDLQVEDLRLAIEHRIKQTFITPPSKDFLLDLAKDKNTQPLPLIAEKHGLRLPPTPFTLTQLNYTFPLKSLPKPMPSPAPKPIQPPSTPIPAAPSTPLAEPTELKVRNHVDAMEVDPPPPPPSEAQHEKLEASEERILE